MPSFSSDPITTEQTHLNHVESLMKVGTWTLDLRDQSIYWSDGVYHLLDYPPQSFIVDFEIGSNIIHPEDRDGALKHMQDVLEKGLEYNITKRLITRTGKSIIVQSKASVIRDENNIPVKLAGVFHDITEFTEIRQNLEDARKTSKILLENADGIFWEADATSFQFTYVSPQALEITGYSSEEWINEPDFWQKHIHPEDRDFAINYCHTQTNLSNNHVFDYRLKTKAGTYIWLHDRVKVISNNGRPIKLTGLMVDVTADYFYDELDKIEKKLLRQAIQQDVQLIELINSYLLDLEQLFPDMKASVMKIQQGKMFTLAAPSFPAEYAAELNGLTIGLNQGSCGTAAFLKEKVIVGNVYEDERWSNHRNLPFKYGFAACWSQPILDDKGDVVATFALYYNTPKIPGTFEEFAIERSQHLLSLVITKFNYLENIKESNDRFELINRATKDAIYDWDIIQDKLLFGDGYNRLFGYSEEISQPVPLSEWSNKIHPADAERVNKSLKFFVENRSLDRWESNYRYKRKDGTYAFIEEIGHIIRNAEGRPTRMVGIMRDNSETRELQILLDNASNLANVGGWELDLINQLLYWSPVTRSIHEVEEGYIPDLEKSVAFYHPEYREMVKQQVDAIIQTGKNFDFEVPIKTAKGNDRWVRAIGNGEFQEGICVRIYGSLQNIHERKTIELELSKKNKLLDTLSIIISEFLQVDEWTTVLPGVFELTGQTVDVDRVYYFELYKDLITGQQHASQRFEWVSEDLQPANNNPDLQEVPIDDFPDYFGPLTKGSPVRLITSGIQDKKLKGILEIQSIKSCLALPVMAGNECLGLIGFDDCREERYWTESEISFLINVTANLAAAIQRKNNQVQLETALFERNTILESIGDGFCAINQLGKITYWNKQAENIFSLPRQQVENKDASSVLAEALQLTDFTALNEALGSRKKKSIEYNNVFTNKWFDLVVYPSGNGTSVFIRDISNRKKTEAQIRQSNERFEIITRATNDAIWDYDVEKDKLFWGHGFSTLFGYNLLETNPSFHFLISLIHPDDRGIVVEKIQGYMDGSTATNNWEEEYRFLKASGEYAYVVDKAIFIRNEQGHVIRALGAMSDISHRKQYEASLKDLNQELEKNLKELALSNQELEQFAYVASHDLQEPLRMVTGFLTQLEKKYHGQLDEKAHQYIYFATDGAKRMRQIILDLLDFSRIGKHNEKLTAVNLNRLVEETIALNRNLMEDKAAIVEFDPLPTILCYYSPLLQVFQNLVANAIKYSKAETSPRIYISAKDLDIEWEISVKDNGIGIAPDYHERIFIIFQRLHKREDYSGTGIGLAIVKKIIDNLGGTICVESEPGVGSVFHFRIPKTIPSRS
ncbi:PAS domain-containing protein [Flavihumibacter sp. UBA7668]|uniref:PAS domain-containing protein n=1 Tax=Flavihumibacter sp. UBA7668 TaxID=1946542 RepID=UPI0025C58C61|nr:PAS domain-containing protein [Flavihumibacter sp. UBA7668]